MLGQTPTGQEASAQHKFLSHGSGVWRRESGVPHSRGGPERTLFRASHLVGGAKDWGPFYGNRFSSSGLHPGHLPKAPQPNTITLEVGLPSKSQHWGRSISDQSLWARGLRRGGMENAVVSRVGGVLGRMGTGTRGRDTAWRPPGLEEDREEGPPIRDLS